MAGLQRDKNGEGQMNIIEFIQTNTMTFFFCLFYLGNLFLMNIECNSKGKFDKKKKAIRGLKKQS